MSKKTLLLPLLFIPAVSQAIDSTTLDIKQITTQGWQLQGLKIALSTIQNTPKLQLSIQKLFLPQPFDDLKLLQVQCSRFNWGKGEIHCQQGQAKLQSKTFQSPRFNFSFHITAKQSDFSIQQLKLLEGLFDIKGSTKGDNWQLSLNGKNAGLNVLHRLLFPELKLSSGKIDLQGKAQGDWLGVKKFNAQLQSHHLSLQTADGTKACEKLALRLSLSGYKMNPHVWQWQNENIFQQGSLYIDPLYLESKDQPLTLQGHGYWHEGKQRLEVDAAEFNHPDVGLIHANGVIDHKSKMAITDANLYFRIPELATASPIYFEPFTTETALEGLSLAGKMAASFKLRQQKLTNAYLSAHKLAVTDKKQRIDLADGLLSLNWSNRADFSKSSLVSWQKLTLAGVSLAANYFPLLLKQQSVSLLEEIKIPLLLGEIRVKKFDWQQQENKPSSVHFAGQVQNVSLEQLSKALEWQKPLRGNISGEIPGVSFIDGKLTLDGGLKINVFDGEIAINKLALSGLLSDFSQFYGDIEINNLDLQQITQRFSFGGMQGRISGYVRNLYLENWKPVSFYAWLGTPEYDDLPHEISQKAVENIASIGGGGVIDLLSRLILNLFDEFSYDEIGLGCYLHDGVCQLMGVEPAEYGYYIVKGGGLPRIDVMGFNTRIDWAVLQERLQRIVNKSKTKTVVE